MNTLRLSSDAPDEEDSIESAPFHQPLEDEEIQAAQAGLSTGSREEGPSQQES